MKHKHADLIHAWADGAAIEVRSLLSGDWVDEIRPSWAINLEYRIKPEPKPDVVRFQNIYGGGYYSERESDMCASNRSGLIKLTFDGETGKLKSAEVLK